MLSETGLVLEGGGMRGVYTAGVLEYFMEQDLFFPYVVGVSAGACHATSYLSRQRGRNRQVNIDFVNDPRYLSWRNYLKTREMFGMNFIFNEIPTSIVPFDFTAFHNREERFVVGTTDCVTGKPAYFENVTDENVLMLVRASSSLPFVAPIVNFDDKQLLDGGISDPIPVRKAQLDGFEKNVIILTRNKGYRKKKSSMMWMAKRPYRQYQGLLQAMENRYQLYNETMDYIEELERQGKLFVIRPTQPLSVGRMERNPVKLQTLYEQGYEEATTQYESLIEWLKN
ncbi:patatin-like phospholipase family protein [Priestia koreensis]|uniref:patatin-like phospholipase family protein n=1 Tax=Priestia koreensis TaxID=284581 RepID=UPI001F5A4223|nr:patatin family protein [Priestia koreensis]UNL85895.1 patatin family protein [Priestia koreensis]